MNRLKSNVNNALKKEVGTVLYAFHLGRARVICARELATKLNQSEVLIRQTIAEMRMEGQPIASSNRQPEGYYIPATLEEANECMEHLRSRVKKICRLFPPGTPISKTGDLSVVLLSVHASSPPLCDTYSSTQSIRLLRRHERLSSSISR